MYRGTRGSQARDVSGLGFEQVQGGHHRRRNRRRRLSLERFEDRVVLASSTTPSILGTVYADRDASGTVSPGEALVGVSIQLVRDNGDGVFGLGADVLTATTTTDPLGDYCFGDLDPDLGYFVVRPAQTVGTLTLEQVVSGLIQPGRPGTLIDQFETRQTAVAIPPAPAEAGSTMSFANEAEVIGRERDLFVQLSSGIGEVGLAVNPFGLEDLLEFKNSPGTVGNRIVTWDGVDGDAEGLAFGLNGRDLTAAGQNDGIMLRGGVDQSGAETEVLIRLFNRDISSPSETSFNLPITGGDPSGYLFIPFAEFQGPVSPADVDAIQLFVSRGAAGTDGKIGLIGANGAKRFDIPEVILADLSATKDNGVEALVPGQPTTYEIVVRNLGPDPVVGARVEDLISTSLGNARYTSRAVGDATGNTPSGTGNISDVVNLAPDSYLVYTIQADVLATALSPVVNTVRIVPPPMVLDPELTNNSATDRDPLGNAIDLAVSKDDGVRSVRVGQKVTYRINVRNFGPIAVQGARVTDFFPSTLDDVTYVSAAAAGASGNTVAGTGDIDDTVNMPVNGIISYIVTGTVSERAVGTLVNRATVSVPTGLVDVNPENNDEIDTDLVERELVDVSVTKTDNLTAVSPGQRLTYSIIVRNSGPSNAAGINVVDQFPVSLLDVTYTSVSLGGATGATPSGTGTLDEIVNLPAGASVLYTVTAMVAPDASGALQNIVTTTLLENDIDPSNNTASDVDALVPQADLAITKTDGLVTARPGDSLTYTVVVSNNGPSDVVGAQVVDPVPTGLEAVTYRREQNGQTVNGQGAINDVIDIAVGESVTYTIDATISATAIGAITNTAVVTPPVGISDPRIGNNTATDIDQLNRANVDLQIRKLVDQAVAVPGREIHYTILVSNIGQTAVAAATIQDTFAPELLNVRYTSRVIGQATGNTSSGQGSLNDQLTLEPGATVIYSVTAQVAPNASGALQNLATVQLTGQVDQNPGNNIDFVVVPLQPAADLSITKTDQRSEVEVGDTLTYEIVVRNSGPSDVSQVSVTDWVPMGLTDVTYTSTTVGNASGNTVSGTGGIVDTLQMPAGSVVTYRFVGRVAASVSGVLSNLATVRGPLETGFEELDPTNNSALDTDLVRSTLNLGSEPTSIRTDAIAEAGQTDRYQITAHSTGKLIITAHFTDAQGDLQLAVDDRLGNPIAVANSTTDDEQLVIPVVAQERYFIRVFGATEQVTNRYDLEVENFAAPIPQVLRLTPATDTGMLNDDAVTFAPNPTVVVQADLADFIAMGVPVLQPVNPAVDNRTVPVGPGAAVEVTLTNLQTGAMTVGYGSAIGAAGQLFQFTPLDASGLISGDYAVTAAVRIFDGKTVAGVASPATGRTNRSDPFWITVDRIAPTAADRPDLLDASDTGTSDIDNVTNKLRPTFRGVTEPNAKVLIYGTRINGQVEVIGRGVATPEGAWEIVTDPLKDGLYHIRAEYQDAAGNSSSIGEPMIIEVDTTPPNTPQLDLIRTSDSGLSNADNVTFTSALTFSMTTEDPGQDERDVPFNYKYRLFVRPDAGDGQSDASEQLVYDSSLDPLLPVTNLLDGLTDLEQLVRALGPFPDGVHNFKLEVEDRAGNISEDFLLNVTIDTVPPPADLELLPSSDSGMFADDRVTNQSEPAFAGVSEVGTQVYLYANGRLVGRGQAGSDPSDGQLGNGRGAWEITSEPLADGEYSVAAQFEDLAGNVAGSTAVTVWVDTRAPNVPLLDLVTDSGFSPFDNLTNDNTPTVTITAGATVAGGANPFPNDIKFRVYDRPGDGAGEVLLIDSWGALRDLTNLGFFTETLPPLADGVHNLKVEIEDRAGNVSHAYLLDVLVDTVAPTSQDAQLLNSSDSGTLSDDRVTRINQPSFSGVGSVGETVYVYANGNFVGQTRVGSDATDFVTGNGLGAWQVTIDPLADGDYEVAMQIEDQAGNRGADLPISLTVDTTRPNIPLLDLISDNGVSDTDNVTNVAQPQFTITINDTPGGGNNPFPHDLKYRLYDRTGSGPETLLIDSFVELDGFSEEGFFTVTLPTLAAGVHNLKLEAEDRAGNISLPFLLEVEVDTDLPLVGPIDLAAYSDSGMNDADNVTHINAPAILGTGSIGDRVLIYVQDQIAGSGIVQGDLTDGTPGNGRGAWEVTLEPLADGVYELVAWVEDTAGNVATSDSLTVEIDTLEPNTPHLDLVEDDDSGRHNDDNVTNSATLVFSATTSDPNESDHLELIPGGQNFKYRLYSRSEQGTEVLVYNSVTDPAITDLLDGLTALNRVSTTPLTLTEGWHNLKLEVEDRAGNISYDFLLDLLADRTPFGGTVTIHPNSDSGLPGLPGSYADGVTQVRTPVFTGTAEANALVTVTIDGQPAGTAVAIPLDGDDAVQPPGEPYDLQGNWTLQSTRALSDGPHTVVVTFEDPAGNRTTRELSIVIDTAGPRIDNVTRNEPGFPSLFDPKPSSGPDPLLESIVIHVTDLAAGESGPIAVSIASEEGHYALVGDANGNMPISQVEVIAVGGTAMQIILHFAEPLPDDRFTLTVADALVDLAGNPLDGESGARSPFEGTPGSSGVAPIFPTGNGVPGGDFVARFTVDSRPEIGTWGAGNVWIDTNGNQHFDPENLDYVNRDIVYRYGFTSDDIFAGNFALPGKTTDGFDKLAAYGRAEGEFRWLVDTDNDGVPNIDRVEPQQVNGLPAAGQFDGDLANGDEVALFDGKYWYFDTDHNFQTDVKLRSFLVGYPIVGDFDGDNFDDLATWADNRFMIDLAGGTLRGWDGIADTVFNFGYIGVRERPVAADLDQDGFTDLGLWVPDRPGITDRDQSEWYFLVSHGESLLERLSPPDDPVDSRPTIDFTPRPFGPDLYARFGDEFALPVVGNFDPPILPLGADGGTSESDDEDNPVLTAWTNPQNALDVTHDGQVSPSDALAIINELNGAGPRALEAQPTGTRYLDVNGDNFVSAIDALLVLNELSRLNVVQMQATSQPQAAVAATDAVASLFATEPNPLRPVADDQHVAPVAVELSPPATTDTGAPLATRPIPVVDPVRPTHDPAVWEELLLILATARHQESRQQLDG